MMKVTRSRKGHFRIESDIVTLGTLLPHVGRARLELVTSPTLDQEVLCYTSPRLKGGKFYLQVQQVNEQVWIKYWLENLPPQFPLISFGFSVTGFENLRSFLQNGYFSWDGSRYIEVENVSDKGGEGYAMTQLLPRYGSGSVVIGFERHDRFQHRFAYYPRVLHIDTELDTKLVTDRIESERLVIFEHLEVEEGLREWARIVAKAMPPRLSAPQITGWCSWYNLYAYINEEVILEHLHGAAKVKQEYDLPLRVFQIDDGFTPEMGDWLEVKPQFPRGMKPLLDEIRAAGFIPGLWIAPLMVGNRSHLYQQHPDWVLHDKYTGEPYIEMKFYGEFRWHKRSEEYYVLDTTHPEAFAYLRQVFRTWRHEWGCEYFKTDFMYFGVNSPVFGMHYQSGLTRTEIWRQMAAMIREEIGEAIWLGCGCPLWPAIGLVDGLRIGKDVGVDWDAGSQTAQSLLQDQSTRNFTNGILWQTDPDCILLRERFHNLSDYELEALAIYAAMPGGVIMTSDALHELSPARIQLFKTLLENNTGCNFPLLGQSDPVLVQTRSNGEGEYEVFLFNTGAQLLQRTYTLTQLGLPAVLYQGEQQVERLSVSLLSHHSQLVRLQARLEKMEGL